jgi:hypothetical protein
MLSVCFVADLMTAGSATGSTRAEVDVRLVNVVWPKD